MSSISWLQFWQTISVPQIELLSNRPASQEVMWPNNIEAHDSDDGVRGEVLTQWSQTIWDKTYENISRDRSVKTSRSLKNFLEDHF